MNYSILLPLLLAPGLVTANCTDSGRYSWTTCNGAEHAAIAVAAMQAAKVGTDVIGLPEPTYRVAGAAACGIFMAREWWGNDRLFNSVDNAADWVAPCVAGLLYDPNKPTGFSFGKVGDGYGVVFRSEW